MKFLHLSFDQFRVGGCQQPHRLIRQGCGSRLRRLSHQKISGEYRDRVRPVGIGRYGAATGVGFVDDVVVIEASEVDEFHCHSRLDRPIVLVGTELGCKYSQQRPVALSPRR